MNQIPKTMKALVAFSGTDYRFCKVGHYWMCQPHEIFGFFGKLNGGMA